MDTNKFLEVELKKFRARELQAAQAQVLKEANKARAAQMLLSIRLQFSHTLPITSTSDNSK